MNSDLDEIKNRLDIVELISEHVQLKRAGQNFKALCPFHSEKTPSFMVSPQKQIYHCFGCGSGGDIFGFTMKYEGLEFREAVELLARRAGIEIKKHTPKHQGEREKLRDIQHEALTHFVRCLSRSKPAAQYLERRGVNKETWKAFSLGFAPAGWHNLYGHLKEKGFEDALILQAGLVVAGSKGPYDIFRERIMFPIFDMHGEVIAFGGRVLGNDMPKYLNSPDTPLFKKRETLYALNSAKDGIREKGYAIVVEGYLDAIMCHQFGFTNAVAPLGTALTEGHVRKLCRLAGNLLMIFDGDPAGIAAAKRSLPLVLNEGLRTKILLLQKGEDPDSILKARGAGHMKTLIAGASSPVDFFLKVEKSRLEATSEAIEVISTMKDPVVRDEFILELSDRTRIGERSIREKLARYKKTGAHVSQKPKGRPYDEETILLSAAIALPEKATAIADRIDLDDIRDPEVRNLLKKFCVELQSFDSVMGTASDEERNLLSMLSVKPGFDISEVDKNVEDCLKQIHRRNTDNEIKRVNEEIRSAEVAGDLELLTRLLSERQRLMHGAK